MEISNYDCWVMIIYDFRHGLTLQQSVEKLNSLFGNKTPSNCKYILQMVRGRPTFDDDLREGCPCTSVVTKHISVRAVILEDRHVTNREIEASWGIASKQIHGHLRVRKLCNSRCLPHHLRDAQKEARIKWCQEMLKTVDSGRSILKKDPLCPPFSRYLQLAN